MLPTSGDDSPEGHLGQTKDARVIGIALGRTAVKSPSADLRATPLMNARSREGGEVVPAPELWL